jgi:hypothetical protein
MSDKPMGRPRIDIDWQQFEKLCAMQCTEEEIAGWFDCHIDTINNRCKDHYGETFSEVFKQKRGRGRASLRRAQWANALGGNATMQIFLGKQHLGQSDKLQAEFMPDVTLNLVMPDDDSGD